MALGQKAFAVELEVATSQSYLSKKQIDILDSQFEDVYMDLQPTLQDFQARKVAVDFVNGLVRDKLSVGDVRKHYGVCNARAFGSFTMDMFTPTSDLDISLNVECGLEALTRDERVKLLKKLTKLLYGLQSNGYVREIQPVFRAKVPVVKFMHCNTGIECDVSIENRDGIIKSEFLRIFSSIDSRFRKLCFLLKAWANAHGINSSKDHTLNSLSIILLVAFHLQTRVPAILPPFSVLLRGTNSSMSSHAVSFVEHEVDIFKGFGKKNSESVVQLFNSFLMKLMAVKDLWQEGLCASSYEGTWTSTTNPSWIFVEDFTSLSQNAARAVNGGGFDAIYACCNQAFILLKSYFLGEREAQSLKSLLFNPRMSSAVHKRKRYNVNHPEFGNHQNENFTIQQTVAEDNEVMSYAPSSRFYDSRLPGQMILNRANVPGRDYLAHSSIDSYLIPTVNTGMLSEHPAKRMKLSRANVRERDYLAHSSIDSYLVPAVNTGILSEHPAKRMKLQHPITGNRYFSAIPDLQPFMLSYHGYPERLLRDDQISHTRKLQSGDQGSYARPESRIGTYEQRHLLRERAAGRTYTGTDSLLLPPFTNDGIPLYSESLKGFNQGTYSSQVPSYGYGFKMHNQY